MAANMVDKTQKIGTRALAIVTALLMVAVLITAAPAAGANVGDGEVFTWGENGLGQLGDGTNTDRGDAVDTGLSAIVDIAGGRHHVVALSANGSVSTWGLNGNGQIGNGTFVNRNSPQVLSLTSVTAVGSGHYHSLAVTDGEVWAWGRGIDGQLGQGDNANRSIPTRVQGISDAVAVAAGREHSIVLHSDGSLSAIGENMYGQLGDGTFTDRTRPVDVTGITNVAVITAGRVHTAVLRSDGTVWTWGDNQFGQLGLGNTTNRNTPQQVTGLPTIVDVEAFGFHTVALDAAGNVWTWGRNTFGQLGDGTTAQRNSPVQVELPTIAVIGSGRDFAMAAAANGDVYGWGRNDEAQLGDGTTQDRSSPVLVDNVADITELVGGRDYIAARTAAGDDVPAPPAPTPVPVPEPQPEPAAPECTATVSGNDLVLEWSTDFTGANIRRNSTWHSTPPFNATTATISNAATDTADYFARFHPNGAPIDALCVRDEANTPPAPTPPAPEPNPGALCTVTGDNQSVTVTWTFAADSINLRENGIWQQGAPAQDRSVSLSGDVNSTWVIIARTDGIRSDVTCVIGGGVTPPAPTPPAPEPNPGALCTVTGDNQSVTVTWTFAADSINLRENGIWQQGAPAQDRSVSLSGDVNSTWVIIARTDGVRTDITCSPAA